MSSDPATRGPAWLYAPHPAGSPLGAAPWPPASGLAVTYRRSPQEASRTATVVAYREILFGSGPLRLVELAEIGWVPWNRCLPNLPMKEVASE